MSDQPEDEPAGEEPDGEQDVVPDETDAQARTRAEVARRRRLDEVFGSGEHHGGGKGDDWYHDQVPPHHG